MMDTMPFSPFVYVFKLYCQPTNQKLITQHYKKKKPTKNKQTNPGHPLNEINSYLVASNATNHIGSNNREVRQSHQYINKKNNLLKQSIQSNIYSEDYPNDFPPYL